MKNADNPTFKKDMGTIGLFMIAVSGIIGSGWLFGVFYASKMAGPAALLAWILGACLIAILGLNFSKLGVMFPVAGGLVRYADYSHGPLLSFMAGWLTWISTFSAAPGESMAIIQYASNYLPYLVKKVDNVTVLTTKGLISSALLMVIMSVLNLYSVRFFSRINCVITAIKLIVPILTIILLFYFGFHLKHVNFSHMTDFMPYGWHSVLVALPLSGVIYSYTGFQTVLHMTEEVKNPKKSVPIALIGSIFFCLLIYGLLQIAFIGSLNPESFLKGWHNLHYSGDTAPFGGLFVLMGITWFAYIIYADALISPFGAGYVYTAVNARLCYGLSKIGLFPKIFEKLSSRGTPVVGIVINFLCGLLLLLPFPSWQKLVGFIVSCFVISYVVGPIVIATLENKKLDKNSGLFVFIKTHWLSFLGFYICNLMLFWSGWEIVYQIMIALIIGFLFFIIYSATSIHGRQQFKQQISSCWWIAVYLIGISVISYLGTFGNGQNKILFGEDFAIIAMFSAVIFCLNLYLARKNPKTLAKQV